MSRRPTRVGRINVAVNATEVAILTALVDREGVSLGEAVNDLIQCGHPVRAALRDGGRVLIYHGDGRREELRFDG